MASGSFDLTTYYAKRIIGDTAATTYDKALLYAGSGINSNMWIFGHNRNNYGILYNYAGTNGTADKIEFHGGNAATATAYIQLDTGDLSAHDITVNNAAVGGALAVTSTSTLTGHVGIGTDSNTTYALTTEGDFFLHGGLRL